MSREDMGSRRRTFFLASRLLGKETRVVVRYPKLALQQIGTTAIWKALRCPSAAVRGGGGIRVGGAPHAGHTAHAGGPVLR